MSEMSGGRKVVFFDGDCALCSGVVQWSHRRDSKERLWFASLGSDFAARHRDELNLPEATGEAQTFVFWDEANGKLHQRSSGVIELLKNLGGAWPLLGYLLFLVPKPIRNGGYGVVARNRRTWFGTTDGCALPPGSLRGRILE